MKDSEWKKKITAAVDKNPPSEETLNFNPGIKSDYDLIDERKNRVLPEKLELASVLVGIIDMEAPHVLLTKRSAYLKEHPGQVAFPGGKVDNNEDVTDAAIREAREEVGILKNEISICGYLDTYETGTGYRILPVVGFITNPYTEINNSREVSEVFKVPLRFLMDERNHKLESSYWKGAVRKYYTIPYNNYYIWGATAGMLRNLFERLKKN